MVIYLGSLVQLCCREGRTLQRNITGVCGEFSKCLGHTGFAPAHGVCAFLVYTAQAPGCSAGELSKEGPGLHALPRSTPLGSGSRVPLQRHRLSWVFCALPRSEQLRRPSGCRVHSSQLDGASYHLLRPSRWVSWVHSRSAISGVLCVNSGALISCYELPDRCQPSRIPGRLG